METTNLTKEEIRAESDAIKAKMAAEKVERQWLEDAAQKIEDLVGVGPQTTVKIWAKGDDRRVYLGAGRNTVATVFIAGENAGEATFYNRISSDVHAELADILRSYADRYESGTWYLAKYL